MTKPSMRTVALSVVALAVAAQLVPVNRDNPPIGVGIVAPDRVAPTLRRACYDCHSHETAWPWYAYVAPASWLVARDVHEGRRHVNFSDWGAYSAPEQQRRLLDIADEAKEGGMPPWYYAPFHAGSALSQADVDTIVGWAESASAQLAGKP